ncbi:MAG: alanyl-tRNA editing protein [Acidilobaceae archaeon]
MPIKTKLLFQYDSYLKEFTAKVERIEGSGIVLDQTAFHPVPHGGLDTDTGVLIATRSKAQARVLKAEIRDDVVVHIVDDPSIFSSGDSVLGVIDWDRRYRMMKLHTAAHVLAAILYQKYNALITGGFVTSEYSRDDFDIEVEDWKSAFEKAVVEANSIISKCIEVRVYWLKREEALKISGIVKLAERVPPEEDVLRVVEIPGVDVQLDGGPHVKNTCEIGEIKLIKIENRGKKKKRIYYTLA